MLTPAERRFVSNPEQFTKSQEWVHRCRINKKISRLVDELGEIIAKNDRLHIKLDGLADLFEANPTFQGSERVQETKQDSSTKKNSFLDDIENW